MNDKKRDALLNMQSWLLDHHKIEIESVLRKIADLNADALKIETNTREALTIIGDALKD